MWSTGFGCFRTAATSIYFHHVGWFLVFFRTDWDGFIIKNFDCGFVVLVTLNRGYAKAKKCGSGVSPPEFNCTSGGVGDNGARPGEQMGQDQQEPVLQALRSSRAAGT